eukprot:scaffold52968_cov74-Phaeocystis_antarctica.AAC.2
MSAKPHESQPAAVNQVRGKYTSVPKTIPTKEAIPSQAPNKSDRSGRRANTLLHSSLVPRFGSTTLRAIGGPAVCSGDCSTGTACLTKVTPSSGSVGTCCSGLPAQKVCGGSARSTTQHAPTTVASPTSAPGVMIDFGPMVALVPMTIGATTITPLRGT